MGTTSLMGTLVFALAALLCSAIYNTAAAGSRSPSRLAINLIHRGSIPGLATVDDLESSMARLAYFTKGRAISMPDDFRGSVVPAHAAIFLVNVSIGQPPVPQLLVFDTGSGMLWIQCTPCTACPRTTTPVFDPTKSSSYVKGACGTTYCTYPVWARKCDSSGQCMFTMMYAGGNRVEGHVGFETLTFETSNKGIATVEQVLIGCAHNIYNLDAAFSGILGLAPDEGYSLALRLGAKFSYCIGDIRDPQYQYNQFRLGNDVEMQGGSTPMDDYNGFYYITLEAISIGGGRLEIDPGVFKRKASGRGGVIIDSGTTYTFLIEDAYNKLRDAVQRLIGGKLPLLGDSKRLCYQGSLARDVGWFPLVTFHFAGGAQLVLDLNSTFKDLGPNKFCMAVVPATPDEVGVIGIVAQQGYNVGYDYENYKIYFDRIKCQLLQS